MKIVSRGGKKILKMSKDDWVKLGKRLKFATELPDPEKVKQIIRTLSQLSNDISGLAQTSKYRFMGEQKQIMDLYNSMRNYLGIIDKPKAVEVPKTSSNKSNKLTKELIAYKLGWVKEAQNLEVVKTPEKFTDRETTRAIRDAIIAEEGAIKQYETVVDASNNELVKKVLQDIANEEKVHVFELQTLLNGLLKDEEKFMEKGTKEVEDKK